MQPNDTDELPEILRTLRGRGDGLPKPGPAYFAQLAERSIREGKQPLRAPLRLLRARTLLTAAATLLLLLFAWFLMNRQLPDPVTSPTSDRLLADIEADVIEEYVSEYADEYDDDILMEASIEN